MDPRTPRNLYRVALPPGRPVSSLSDRVGHFVDIGAHWLHLSGLVTDPTVDRPVEGLAEFSERARASGLGILVDLGPAAVSTDPSSSSPWWQDVLAHGARSSYAGAFDIDWAASRGGLTYRRWRGDSGFAALRVEDPKVFEQTYAEVRRWFSEDLVDGVCVNDADDLWDPPEFARRLRGLAGGALVRIDSGLGPVGTSVETLTPEVAWIARDLPSPGRGFVSRVRKRLGSQSTALGLPTEIVLEALSELLTDFPASRSHLPEGREHLDAAIARVMGERPDLRSAVEALTPVLADPAQPAARRFEVAAAALRASRLEVTPDAPMGVIAQIEALTGPEVPEVDDLGEGAQMWRSTVCAAGLRLRRDRPELFSSHSPVETFGSDAEHLSAFDRGGVVVVAGPLDHHTWGTTEIALPAGDWWDHVTGRDLGSDGRVYAGEVLDLAPAALLTRDER